MTNANEQIATLAAELIDAAQRFDEKGPVIQTAYGMHSDETGHRDDHIPNVVYAQLDRDGDWTCEFLKDSNFYDDQLTRWSSGDDVEALYAAIKSGDHSAVENYAAAIIDGWDEDWSH